MVQISFSKRGNQDNLTKHKNNTWNIHEAKPKSIYIPYKFKNCGAHTWRSSISSAYPYSTQVGALQPSIPAAQKSLLLNILKILIPIKHTYQSFLWYVG